MKRSFSMNLIPLVAVAVTSAIGFLVAYQSAPNIAWGRLFIDLGVILAIIFLSFAFRRRSESETKQPIPSPTPVIPIQNPADDLSMHSHHPEIGSVKALNLMRDNLSQLSSNNKKNLFDSEVGVPTKIKEISNIEPEKISDFSKEQSVHAHNPDNDTTIHIEDLFAQYSQARKENKLSEISFETFQQTVEDTRKALLTRHECKGVRFDVVTNSGDVALRPRLIK